MGSSRTHYLKDLNITGREKALELFPDFDFYKLHQVLRFSWTMQPSQVERVTREVTMTAVYEASLTIFAEVSFRFVGVTFVKIDELRPDWWLHEIEVEDVKTAQLEGVRHTVMAYGNHQLQINCQDFEILDCKLVAGYERLAPTL